MLTIKKVLMIDLSVSVLVSVWNLTGRLRVWTKVCPL